MSYSRRDQPFVRQLSADLEAHGAVVWLDTEDIVRSPDNAFRSAIVGGIVSSAAVIVVLSPDSVASAQVERELNVAADNNRRVVPVVYRRCTIPNSFQYVMAGLQQIDFSHQDYAIALAQLEQQLEAVVIPPPPVEVTPPIDRRSPKRRPLWFVVGAAAVVGTIAVGRVRRPRRRRHDARDHDHDHPTSTTTSTPTTSLATSAEALTCPLEALRGSISSAMMLAPEVATAPAGIDAARVPAGRGRSTVSSDRTRRPRSRRRSDSSGSAIDGEAGPRDAGGDLRGAPQEVDHAPHPLTLRTAHGSDRSGRPGTCGPNAKSADPASSLLTPSAAGT